MGDLVLDDTRSGAASVTLVTCVRTCQALWARLGYTLALTQTSGNSWKMGFSSSDNLIFNLFMESVAFGGDLFLRHYEWGQLGFFPQGRCFDEGLGSHPWDSWLPCSFCPTGQDFMVSKTLLAAWPAFMKEDAQNHSVWEA